MNDLGRMEARAKALLSCSGAVIQAVSDAVAQDSLDLISEVKKLRLVVEHLEIECEGLNSALDKV